MYLQLDEVGFDDIEPIGRVNNIPPSPWNNPGRSWAGHLVGFDKTTGSLVRALAEVLSLGLDQPWRGAELPLIIFA